MYAEHSGWERFWEWFIWDALVGPSEEIINP
jgi:hypothetical protein